MSILDTIREAVGAALVAAGAVVMPEPVEPVVEIPIELPVEAPAPEPATVYAVPDDGGVKRAD